MAAINPPWTLQNVGATHPSDLFRDLLKGLRGQPGAMGSGDLVVSQHPAPAMNVDIAAGKAVVDGTQTPLTQGSYFVRNDGVVTLAIAAADPTNPRWDIVVAQVEDAFYAGGVNAWKLAVITGTPAPSPADPVVPANCLKLARVVVAALAGSIVNANIADLRTIGTIVARNVIPLPHVAGAGFAGTSLLASPVDHQHQGVLRVRSSQTAIAAINAIVAGTYVNFGASVNITTTVASLLIVIGTGDGVASVSTTIHFRMLFGGASGDGGALGSNIRHDALGSAGGPILETFQQGAAGTTTVQAQVTMDNNGNFTPNGRQLQLVILAIPLA